MLRSPLRGLRAPLKLLLLALSLFLLYSLLPVLLPLSSSSSSSLPDGPYSDSASAKRVRDELLLAPESEGGKRRGSGVYGGERGSEGADGSERGRRREEGGEEGWAPRGGAPPRRGEREGEEPRRPQRPHPPPPVPPPPPPPAAKPADTYEQELAALEARREAQRKKLREWDERVAAAEREEREREGMGERRMVKVPNVGEEGERGKGRGGGGAAGLGVGLRKKKRPPSGRGEDDELDAVQKGGVPGRGEGKGGGGAFAPLGGSRKKGPLIQVGGAVHAAGAPDAEERAEKAQAAQAAVKGAERVGKGKGGAKDQWRGKGWDQRFRKQPVGAVVEERSEDREQQERAEEEESSSSSSSDSASPLLDHHLVKRLAQYDFIASASSSSPSELVIDPNLEDSFQASRDDGETEKEEEKKHNITICALIPHEQRFLPEWLLYHRLLGVTRFALYDTSHPGAFGAGEIDALADIAVKGGAGELGPTVEELKAQVGSVDAGREGLDERGLVREERIEGLERWIEQGTVRLHWMRFGDKKTAGSFFEHMLEHCSSTYGPTSDWLAQLDVDEFLSVSSSLYGADAPYFSPSASSSESSSSDEDPPPDPLDPSTSSSSSSSPTPPALQYPLHDLLSRPELSEAACIPLPELQFRNFGVRELKKRQGVLETQTHRDVLRQGKKVLREEGVQQKTLIHTAFSSSPLVSFSGPHSCKVRDAAASVAREGVTTAIKNSQGVLLQEGGLYEVAKLPIEPLAISHYTQRDLLDCLSKLGSLSDPNDLHSKSRGALSCERHYIPSPSELSSRSFRSSPENRFLAETPKEGSVVVDGRMRDSWAARAAKEVLGEWGRRRGKSAEGRTRGGLVGRETVERAKRRVEVLDF